jgi:hypothetical protein
MLKLKALAMTFSHTLTKAGEFPYFSEGDSGKVIVTTENMASGKDGTTPQQVTTTTTITPPPQMEQGSSAITMPFIPSQPSVESQGKIPLSTPTESASPGTVANSESRNNSPGTTATLMPVTPSTTTQASITTTTGLDDCSFMSEEGKRSGIRNCAGYNTPTSTTITQPDYSNSIPEVPHTTSTTTAATTTGNATVECIDIQVLIMTRATRRDTTTE